MNLKKLAENYPKDFFNYAEKILDSYFGNIFITYRNEQILYVNERMANSVHMSKDEITNMSLAELRAKKLWLRSVSQEMYDSQKQSFNAYNVSKYGDELFTHIEPIFDESGELIMSAQFSIPRQMLTSFSSHIDTEKSNLDQYKDIVKYLEAQNTFSDSIICESQASKFVFEDARYFGSIDGTVLICGETGSGKDVIANYIYKNSKRAEQPFIPVNCSAIPSELMESEFFGYEKGAFTDARRDKPGRMEVASGGTLFLDEIGNLSLPMQAKLLTAIEKRQILRLGATRSVPIDVRLISATNMNIHAMVQEGTFRQDLLYRINTIELHIPPLRERGNDILLLADYFLNRYVRKYKKKIGGLTRDAKTKLQSYAWPGNVRELQHAIERAVILSDGSMLKPENFMLHPAPAQQKGEPEELNLSVLEKEAIERALRRADGNITRAAELLGITRFALYRKLDKLGL